MKAYYTLFIVPLLIATACSPSYVGTSAFQDDIYYAPGEESLIDKEMAVYTTKPVEGKPVLQQTTKVKPTTKTAFGDDRDFQQIQKQYSKTLKNNATESIDTTYYNDEQGYFIDEFNGTNSDLQDIKRLREWYPQGFGYYDNSGYNLAMWLAGDSDWNVYVDGDKVWWTPSWTNFNHYNAFHFSPTRYGRQFAYNYPGYGSSYGFEIGNGFYNDFYWGGNIGWGSSYYNHYSNYGYGYPYYGYHYNYYNYPKQSNNYYGARKTTGSKLGTNRTHTSRNANANGTTNQIRRSSNYSNSGTTTRRSISTQKNAIRRSSASQRYGNKNTRSAYHQLGTTNGTIKRSNYNGNTTRYGTQNRSSYKKNKTEATTTRRTSNYTKPQNSSRPSYNKSGTRRSTNVRSTGTRSSKYSKVKSTPTYRKNSTRSSSNTYRPARSSSSRSTGTVRSSGSSSRSSNGNNRSGGGSRRR